MRKALIENNLKGGEIMEVKFICKDCGIQFTMDQGEIEFYHKQKFELPKRCPKCRAARKQQRR